MYEKIRKMTCHTGFINKLPESQCAFNEDSDQFVHKHRLICSFAVRAIGNLTYVHHVTATEETDQIGLLPCLILVFTGPCNFYMQWFINYCYLS